MRKYSFPNHAEKEADDVTSEQGKTKKRKTNKSNAVWQICKKADLRMLGSF